MHSSDATMRWTYILDLWSLRVLDAVVSVGTISGAAVMVRRTQPQVSRIVKDIETELGFPLFHRQGRRLAPTPRCVRIIEHGRDILDRFSEMDNLARSLRDEVKPGLHVVGPPYAFHGIIPKVIAQLRAEMPEIPMSITSLGRDVGGNWMMPPTFDIGVGIVPFDHHGLVQFPIGKMAAGIVMPYGHTLSNRSSLGIRDLEGHAFIALKQAAPLRRKMDRLFEMEGVSPTIAVTVPDSGAALRMVAEGVGITIGDQLSLDVYGSDRLTWVKLEGLPTPDLGVFWPVGSNQHPARGRFVDLATKLLS